MTKVLSLIFAAAQHLDFSCTDCWNRAVRFGRPDLLELCANSDSRQWKNGYDLTTRRGRERLYQLCSTKRPRHVWYSGWNYSRGRVQAIGCHVHCAQPLSAFTWRQNSLMRMSEKMIKAVVNGFTRKSIEPILASFDHKARRSKSAEPSNLRQETQHGRLFDLSSESSLLFPKSLCRTWAKQFLVKDSWHSVLGILEHLHPDEDERPFNPSASSHETPPALPPSALPPPAPLVDADPNSSERKEITNWLQIGHRDNRTLVRLLK